MGYIKTKNIGFMQFFKIGKCLQSLKYLVELKISQRRDGRS